jgi:hypothetical protein
MQSSLYSHPDNQPVGFDLLLDLINGAVLELASVFGHEDDQRKYPEMIGRRFDDLSQIEN